MNWFYNLKISTKLLTSFTLVVLIAGMIGYVGIMNIRKIEALDTKMYQQMTVPISQLTGITTSFQRIRVNIRDLITASIPEDKQKYVDNIKGLNAEIDTNTDLYEKTLFTDEGRAIFKEFLDKHKAFSVQLDRVIELAMAEKDAEARALISENGESGKASRAEQNAINKLVEAKIGLAKKTSDENMATAEVVVGFMITLMIVGLAVAIGLSLFITRIISKPVAELVRVANTASSGDLTVNISANSKDEIGRLADAFKVMINQMKELVQQIVEKSNMVAGASQQLTSTSQQTAASSNETATTMGEIAATVEQVTSNTQKISQASESAVGHANEGNTGITRVTEQMKNIVNSSKMVTVIIDELDKKSQEINQIVELITSIADQTNLLALNAAIEAARAGEQGRGFAVVAEEVRKLAEQSANATKEINNLISAIQHESQTAVESMAEGGKEVEEGTRIVQEVGANFKEIIGAVQGLTSQIQDVATATEQMSSGVQNVAASTEEQTAAMEEVSASAESLSKLSEELNTLVGKFKV